MGYVFIVTDVPQRKKAGKLAKVFKVPALGFFVIRSQHLSFFLYSFICRAILARAWRLNSSGSIIEMSLSISKSSWSLADELSLSILSFPEVQRSLPFQIFFALSTAWVYTNWYCCFCSLTSPTDTAGCYDFRAFFFLTTGIARWLIHVWSWSPCHELALLKWFVAIKTNGDFDSVVVPSS